MKPRSSFHRVAEPIAPPNDPFEKKSNIKVYDSDESIQNQVNSLSLETEYDLDPYELEVILDNALIEAQASPYFNMWALRQAINERTDELLSEEIDDT